MNSEPTVNCYWHQQNGKAYFRFDFIGHFDTASAKEAIKKWKMAFEGEAASPKRIDLIFECIAMEGYDTGARVAWQDAMKDLKQQIGEIWIISENVLILGAAKTMGVLTGFKIKAVKAVDFIH